MATWNRQPTGDEDSRDSTTALVRWVAAGYLTTKEALEDPNFPVSRNDPHPDHGASDKRRAENIRIVASGFAVMTVEARYSIPPTGTHQASEPSLSNPLIYSWATVQESVAIDRDRDGNAILTSARRAVNGITQTRNYKRLTVTRWESSYNLTTALEFENTVNGAPFEGAAVGAVKCAIIQPSQSYTTESTLIPIDYQFDFKAPAIWGDHPHQTQFVDQDSFAYRDGGDLVRIVTQAGELVTDAPLNGDGTPIDSSLTYFENATDESPVESPSWAAAAALNGATVITAGAVKMLRFNTLPEKNYGSLGL